MPPLAPPTCSRPVPFGTKLSETSVSPPVALRDGGFPVAALVTVTSLTAEPVSTNRNNSSPAPSVTWLPFGSRLPDNWTTPVPFGVRTTSMFVSPPVAEIIGLAAAAAFVIVISLTALATSAATRISFPLSSASTTSPVPLDRNSKSMFVSVPVAMTCVATPVADATKSNPLTGVATVPTQRYRSMPLSARSSLSSVSAVKCVSASPSKIRRWPSRSLAAVAGHARLSPLFRILSNSALMSAAVRTSAIQFLTRETAMTNYSPSSGATDARRRAAPPGT